SELESILRAADDRLRKFLHDGPIPANPLTFEYRTGGIAESMPRNSELLFSSSWDTQLDIASMGARLDIYRQDGRWWYDLHNHGHLLHDPAAGRLSGHLLGEATLNPAFFFAYALLLPLDESLKHRGLFPIHASAVEKDGRAVLIPSRSGGGKTTSCLALLRAGYKSLSDDRPFLRERRSGEVVEVLPFPDRFDVTEATIAFFPELQRWAQSSPAPGRRKRPVDPELIYPGCLGDAAVPELILFPQATAQQGHRVVPLPKATALQEILPHSLLVFDPQMSARQFDLLARLIKQADCYRLLLGSNPLELPTLVDSLLAARHPRSQDACRSPHEKM
ncbi:MAG: hypothetical protein ACRDGN_06780, partial [bacterium]